MLRHLNVLLGYNQTEKSFSVPPYKLRSVPRRDSNSLRVFAYECILRESINWTFFLK